MQRVFIICMVSNIFAAFATPCLNVGDDFPASKKQALQSVNVSRVTLELYYASLCRNSQAFISLQLFPTWTLLNGTDILSIDLYAYGNAHQIQYPNGSWVFFCQHDEKECKGNMIQACTIDRAENESVPYMPIIQCMTNDEDPVAAAQNCIKEKSKLNAADIMACAESEQGRILHHQFGVKTESLHPKPEFLPWVVLNGQHSRKIQTEANTDLLGLVCRMYQGDKPHICRMRQAADDLKVLYNSSVWPRSFHVCCIVASYLVVAFLQR